MKKPALKTSKTFKEIQGIFETVRVLAYVLQKKDGLTTEEARQEALQRVLGVLAVVPNDKPKEKRGDHALNLGGPPWVSIGEAAASFGVSRRTIERWLKSGCTVALKSGQVVTIVLKQRKKSATGRGKLVSMAQIQELILARGLASSPGRKLPKIVRPLTRIPPQITPQTAKNMWRCSRVVTLLRGVNDSEMLTRVRDQVSLQIRRCA